jgi:hypothetical protein
LQTDATRSVRTRRDGPCVAECQGIESTQGLYASQTSLTMERDPYAFQMLNVWADIG